YKVLIIPYPDTTKIPAKFQYSQSSSQHHQVPDTNKLPSIPSFQPYKFSTLHVPDTTKFGYW
ncbi:4182_t:CDS:1, partial [Dentiscutata heterogama]